MKPKKNFQKTYDKFKDHFQTEGYRLDLIQEVYLPYWYCKQNVVIEKDIEVDKFSRVLLELIHSGVSSHAEICQFLGVDEDSFVLMQFHYLISHDLITENDQNHYEITHEGIRFLEDKGVLQKTEVVEFEYMVDLTMELLATTDFKYLYNDLEKKFIDENVTSDAYNVLSTINLKNKEKKLPINHLPHGNKPAVSKYKSTDFSEFFNKNHPDGSFYDFETNKIEAHKRSIKFLILVYKNETNQTKIEIRQSKDSVQKFDGNKIEENLSTEVKKYITDNPDFLNKLLR